MLLRYWSNNITPDLFWISPSCQDRKPLKADVEIPQSLADQASAKLNSLCDALQTSDEQMAEMMKAWPSAVLKSWMTHCLSINQPNVIF